MTIHRTNFRTPPPVHRPPVGFFMVLWILLLVTPSISAPIVDPASAGFGSQNRSLNLQNLTDNWRRYENVTMTVTINGKPSEVVPWMTRGDMCTLAQGANGLHACQNTAAPFASASLNNETFCMVTDEGSQVMLSDALSNHNGTRLANWVNTLENYQTCGQAGNLTEWTVGIRYVGSGAWELNCSQVADSASDADAHFIAGLGMINNSLVVNASVRARAGALLGAMCLGLADENFLPYNISSRINRGENISYLPCGGDDVCTAPNGGSFMYTGYNGPILEALATCQAYYGSDTTRNWTKLADSTVQAHLQASNWTGSAFTVGLGRAYHWANYTGGGLAYAVCDAVCGPDYTDDPDGMRAPRICNGGYVWSAYRNTTLRNLTTYCQQWHNLVGETGTTHVIERYSNGTAKSSTSDNGYKAVGLGVFMNTLVNTSLADDRLDQYNTHLGSAGGNSRLTMDSQACFGVYDKAFGIIGLGYSIGQAEASMTATPSNSGGGGETPSLNFTSILNTPANESTSTTGNVTLNVTVSTTNYTQSCTTNTSFSIVYTNTTKVQGSAWGNYFITTLNHDTYPYVEYNLTFQLPSGLANPPKFYWDSQASSHGDEDIYFEWASTVYSLKYEPGYDRQIDNINAGTVNAVVKVNYTADTFIFCIGATCTSSRAFTDAGNDYASIAWGDSASANLTRLDASADTTTTNCTTNPTLLNVTFQWTNGTVINTTTQTSNNTAVVTQLRDLPDGTYTWRVNITNGVQNQLFSPYTFTVNRPAPPTPENPTNTSDLTGTERILIVMIGTIAAYGAFVVNGDLNPMTVIAITMLVIVLATVL